MKTRIIPVCLTLTAFVACSCSVEDAGNPLAENDGDQLSEEALGSATDSLTKGAVGALNGDTDYCNDPLQACASGEGDCDSDAQCDGGTVCVANNGPKFGFPSGWDICAPAHCANEVLDGAETSVDCGGPCGTCTSCVGASGGKDFCVGCLCASGAGDCDADSQCQTGLTCVADNGPYFNLPAGYDVCVPSHCTNGLRDDASGETGVDDGGPCGGGAGCVGSEGSTSFCVGCSCASGQGDCDSSRECANGLACGTDNGPKFALPAGYDVCVPAHCTNRLKDLASGETGIDSGGPCGSGFGNFNVTGTVNLASDNSGTRSCADGGDAVSYSVTALAAGGATLSAAPSAGCLAAGDEVLLINLQGTATAFANVGNYETLKVSSVVGNSVTFSASKVGFYGDIGGADTNLGTARTNQRVMLQRVPSYQNVSVPAGATLTGGAWNGVKGGVLFLRAAGSVSVAGTVSMSSKGYAGGITNTVVNSTGFQGESLHGLGARLGAASQGGGGGGIGDGNGCQAYGTSGGGAGYGLSGSGSSTVCKGFGGGTYGELSLVTKLMLGSGGGSGGTDNVLHDNPPGGFGGAGGGIVVLLARQLSVTGSIVAAGANGQGDPVGVECSGGSTSSCWDFSGPGGAGSGGSILFNANDAAVGSNLVTAGGGIGGNGRNASGGNGGNGGAGRIAIKFVSSLSGTTTPAAAASN